VPTIGGGESPGRKWWWRELKESYEHPPHLEYTKKGAKNRQFPTIDFKIAENAVFYSKVCNKIYFQDVF
jgi:hypothetical protein